MVDVHNIAQKGQQQRAYMQQLQETNSTKFFQTISNTYKAQNTPLNLQKLLDIQQKQLSQVQQEEIQPSAVSSKPSSPRGKIDSHTIRIPSPTVVLPPIMAEGYSMISFQDSIVSETDSLLLDQLRSQAEQVFTSHITEQSIDQVPQPLENLLPFLLMPPYHMTIILL
jgi:hypothetical protein